jgi:uncharacterized protein YqeY
MREKLRAALKDATRAGETTRAATLRLVLMALSDRLGGMDAEATSPETAEAALRDIISTMIRQRRKQIRDYEESGRLSLAAIEETEVAVLQDFLPHRLNDAEIDEAIATAIDETGAKGIRDLGRVVAMMRDRHGGSVDFKDVGRRVQARLVAPV